MPVKAQVEVWQETILKIIFGELPPVCEIDITRPECIQCLGYIKFLPFLAIFVLFFWILGTIVWYSRPRAGEVKMGPIVIPATGLAPFEHKLVTVLSFIFSVIILHALSPATLIANFVILANFFIFLAVLALILGIARGYKIRLWLSVVLLLLLWLVLWSFIGRIITPVIREWKELCL